MESVGERLLHAREERQLTIEQAAGDTHIARRFIESLEREDFGVFPGESYLIGFLRKYSVYLELDANEMVSLFKNTQLQEQPSPVDELLNKRHPRRLRAVLITLAVVIIVSAIVTSVILILPDEPRQVIQPSPFRTVAFSSEILEQEFEAWTSIQVSTEEGLHSIELREVTSPLILYFNERMIQLNPDDVEFVDLNADTRPDLRIVYKTTLSNGNPILRVDRTIAGSFSQGLTGSGEDEGSLNPGLTTEPSREKSVQRITTLSQPGTFFVEAIFRAPVLFRHYSDGGQRKEQFYTSGDRFQLEVENYVYIWLSNAGKLQFTVNGQDLRLGDDGLVAAYKIARRNNELELIPLY